MNSNGQNSQNGSLGSGGTITGPLNIEADLTVTGTSDFQDITATNAVITGTLEVGTIVSDIIVEDPLIHLGLGNPADIQNLGVLEEFNDGTVKFSGIVRSKDDKKQYLLEGITPQPTGTTNITALNRGNLVINDLSANLLIVNNVASTQAVNAQTLGIANTGLVVRYTLDHELATDDLRVLNGTSTPIASLTQTGDLTTVGDITTYNLDVVGNYAKITDESTYIYNFQYGQKVSARFDNSSGGVIDIYQKTRGTKSVRTAVLNNDVLYTQFYQGHNGTSADAGVLVRARCTEDWSVGNAGTSYTIQVNNTGTNTLLDKLIIGDNIQIANGDLLLNLNDISNIGTLDTNVLTVGNTGVEFTLPSARSLTTNQVLKDVLGDGVLSWETETSSSETLQEAYDASTSPHITTTDIKGPLVLKHAGDPTVDYVLEIKDSVDTINFSVDKLGGVFSNGFVHTSSILQGNDIRAINSMEIGSGAGVSYQLPPNRTGVTNGEMLVLNDATSILEFQKPLYFFNFSQNFTTSNISGTTDEIDITSAVGIGSLVIPANSLVAGATYHIKCGGTIENTTVNDELRLRFYLGTSVIIDTGIMDLPKISDEEPWIFEGDLTFRTIGVTAGSVFNGQFSFNDAGSYLGVNVVGAGDTVDLTASQTWRGTSQWSNASVTNRLYTQILYFYRVS